MKKVIVFGSNGYLGRHIIYFLKRDNIEFLPIDCAETSIDQHLNYKQIDIVNSNEIDVLDFKVDYIFVFAGLTGTNIGFEDYERFVAVNEIGLLNILNHHKNSNSVARIVFPSTRLVYKGLKNQPLKESAEKEAKTIYAQNKLACEQYLNMYQNYYGIEYTIFRICVPYGNLIDNNYSYGTLGFFLNKVKNNENIPLYGNGDQKRTFTHVGDIAKIIIQSINSESTKNKVYNIGSNDNHSLLEVANMIASKNSIEVTLVEWPDEALKVESGDTIFDDVNLKQDVSFEYHFSLKEWLENMK